MHRLNNAALFHTMLFIYLWPMTLFMNGNKETRPLATPVSFFQNSNTLFKIEITPWARLINLNTEELKNIYLTNAVKLNNEAEVISGNTAINTYYKNNPLHIDSIKVITRIDASPMKVYELGKIYSADHKTYHYLHIWHTADNEKKIELEFIEASGLSRPVMNEINKAREEWMRLCNLHDASKLINRMYTDHALYYNHKPMIIGRASIIREYGYMNNVNYHLKLEPIRSEVVNEKIVFEIGQCSGSYGGKYMIVWQKNESGLWQVLMDSNI